MKKFFFSMMALAISAFALAQVDTDQLALDVSKAEAANKDQLTAFIWKRHTSVSVNGAVTSTLVNELSFDETGKLQVTQINAESNVKDKRGVRGKLQENAMEDNMDYVSEALSLAVSYTYMSKGQLLDFFGKAEVTDLGSSYQIVGADVLVKGDKLTVVVEKSTNLFLSKTFTTLMGPDAMSGDVTYEKFSSGISHVTATQVTLAAKNAVINAKNQDYTARIQ